MNFNKDYPIAILDTNIIINCPNILDILMCNIVIPQTVLDELDKPKLKDKLKKQNKYPRIFLNYLKEKSNITNLSKDGYKLKNDCMLYLDRYNLKHREVNFYDKKPDLQFIALAKNIKEKYRNMEVVIVSQDGNLKLYANTYDVKVKTLQEFKNDNPKIFANNINISEVIGAVTGVIGAIGLIGAGIVGIMSKNKGYKAKPFNANIYKGFGRKNRRF
ncbi:PIN domain-containing protein [Brachyspira sp.]|uniref:PIN domain-containing protein n=1 Tax=Brachyspira sp. TaxID=1977261 RepID=UPI003D7E5D6A